MTQLPRLRGCEAAPRPPLNWKEYMGEIFIAAYVVRQHLSSASAVFETYLVQMISRKSWAGFSKDSLSKTELSIDAYTTTTCFAQQLR